MRRRSNLQPRELAGGAIECRRLPEDHVADGEGGGGGADTAGERDDGDGGRDRVPGDAADTKAQVLRQVIEPGQAPRLVEALARGEDTAELAPRREPGLLGCQPVADQPLDLEREVGVDLVGEVLFGSTG